MQTAARKPKTPHQATFDELIAQQDALNESRFAGKKKRAGEPELPAWFLDTARKKQQAAFLNPRDVRGAEEIFASEDKLNRFRALVRTGAPAQKLYALRPRAVNFKRRDSAVWDYFLWLKKTSHPEFEKNITNLVADVNDFRKKMTPRGRAQFDYQLRALFKEKGHYPEQFFIHFPEVHPPEESGFGKDYVPSLSNKQSARRKNLNSMPRITE